MNFVFDRKIAFWIVWLTLPLLFLPKISLLRLDEETVAGIRVDDIVLFLLGLFLLWGHLSASKGLIAIESSVLAITALSLFSFLVNRLLFEKDIVHQPAGIFHAIRLFEYFMFFYIGWIASNMISMRKILIVFFLWNALLMIAQKFSVIGQYSSIFGYQDDGSYRVSGIASFPSEMAALLNILFCFFLFKDSNDTSVSKISGILLFIAFSALIIITGSRIALPALILPFLAFLKDKIHKNSVVHWVTISILILAVAGSAAFFIEKTESISTRSQGLLNWNNVEIAKEVWNNTDINKSSNLAYLESSENIMEYDLSWLIRLHKWCYALKSYLYHPECYLQGLGPGFAGMALDGGLLRILVEYGLIGVYLFWTLFRQIYTLSKALKWIIISFFINMLFFDAYLAYKPMSLLLLLTGYTYAFSKQKSCSSNGHLSGGKVCRATD